MKDFCIIIPVYKETLDCVEEISLKRLKTVIGHKNYDVYLVCPENMNCKKYYDIYNDETEQLIVNYFNPKFFISTASYSQLCMSYDFYYRYDYYDYMLIYQLDCYLFKDDILEWCNKGYDYCGAPIISTDCGWTTIQNSYKGKVWQPYVGNGGFSLRKIKTFMDICNPNGELLTTYKELTPEILSKVKYEDKYFCNDLYNYYKLELPSWIECLDFSLDMSVDVIYNYFNYNNIPMGIHSVDKNIRWWQHIIPEFNDKKIIDYCENKHKDFFKLYYDENNSTMR